MSYSWSNWIAATPFFGLSVHLGTQLLNFCKRDEQIELQRVVCFEKVYSRFFASCHVELLSRHFLLLLTVMQPLFLLL